jgi:hypothetical protein
MYYSIVYALAVCALTRFVVVVLASDVEALGNSVVVHELRALLRRMP